MPAHANFSPAPDDVRHAARKDFGNHVRVGVEAALHNPAEDDQRFAPARSPLRREGARA